jgi:hypothetical protein
MSETKSNSSYFIMLAVMLQVDAGSMEVDIEPSRQ